MKIPRSRRHYAAHQRRVEGYARDVDRLLMSLAMETITAHQSMGGTAEMLTHPAYRRIVQRMERDLARRLWAHITTGTRSEWAHSDRATDSLVRAVLPRSRQGKYLGTNPDAVEAFIQRRRGGLLLSDRVWSIAQRSAEEIATAIELGLAEGQSAAELSRSVRTALREPRKLFRRVRDAEGKLRLSRPALVYNPGTGVYRSSYQNAMRLVRTETNMAYRTAEQERWQTLDFVVGYEVKRSGTGYPCDLCDSLAGKYPKDFHWATWHPNCRCYAIPILKTEDELFASDLSAPSVNEVSELPEGFQRWTNENTQRIASAQRRGTAPYWIRDNQSLIYHQRTVADGYIDDARKMSTKAIAVGDELQGLALGIAHKHQATVTPINYKSTASMIRKAESEKVSPLDLKDAVRTTIVADRGLEGIIADLLDDPAFLRYKRQDPEIFNGYSGHIINLRMPNGITAEVQVNTSRMIYAKEAPENAIRIIGKERWEAIRREVGVEGGLGHALYEQIRVLNPAKDRELIAALSEKSRQYYALFQ